MWSFANRFSSIIGLMGLGLLQNLLGLQKAILVCSVFFLIAMVIAIFIDEKRGQEAARNHTGE